MKFTLALTLLATVAFAATCDTEKAALDKAKKDLADVAADELEVIKQALRDDVPVKQKAYDECIAKASNCPTKKEDCKDSNDSCAGWAKAGECTANPKWMEPNCASSCCPICGSTKKALKAGECPEQGDYGACLVNSANKDHTCQKWASSGKKVGDKLESECGANKEWMVTNCMQSCCETCFHFENGCPTLDVDDVNKQEFKEDGAKVVPKDDLVKRCVDKPEDAKYTADQCVEWAKKDECTKNPTWMMKNCKKSCCPVCQPTMPAAIPTAKPTAKPTARPTAAAVRYVQQAPVSYAQPQYYQAAPQYSGYSTGSYAPQYSGYSTGAYTSGYGFGSGSTLNWGR